MFLPQPRGPLSHTLFTVLTDDLRDLSRLSTLVVANDIDVLLDDDFQIALWALYELHYGGFEDVGDDVEWSPELIAFRTRLEVPFEAAVRRVAAPLTASLDALEGEFPERLFQLVVADGAPSVARHMRSRASREQADEFLIHRSIYTLKEADPHSWCIPRLQGPAKVALVELQYDEYGAGSSTRQHARMFADTLAAAGLDTHYGAYIDAAPAVTLAVNNMLTLFGLHRRLRGAAMGHLAAFEATSSRPARDISRGLQRLGLEDARPYFDEHVEADAVHEQLAARGICQVLIDEDPLIETEIAVGVGACLAMDDLAGTWMLEQWQHGRSSLRSADETRNVISAASQW